MSVQRWTAEKNIQFIEAYKQHECLWNPRHVEYKHQRVRNMAYEEIRKAMGMDSMKEVIARIRILRSTQNNEMTKAKKNEHYVSKISWIPYMDFIRDIVRVAQRGKDETQVVLHRSDTVSSEEESRSSLVQESYRINSNRINNAEMLFELSQRWTAEKSIEFLQIYKKFECLWNPKHEKYKNLLARNHAYKNIMEVMGMDSVKVVKAKIRSLRTTHYNETLKAKKNFNYVSRISWVPYLDFINDVRVIDRKLEEVATTSQEDTQDSYHSDSGSSEESSLIDPPDEKRIKLEDPLVEEVEDSHLQEESDLIDQSVEKRTQIEDPLVQKSEESHLQEESDLIDQSVEKRTQIEDLLVQESEESHLQEMVSVPPSKDNDEFGLFGQTVAEQLRQLPLEVALETEEMILSTIRSQRIKILASTSSQIGNFPMKQELD